MKTEQDIREGLTNVKHHLDKSMDVIDLLSDAIKTVVTMIETARREDDLLNYRASSQEIIKHLTEVSEQLIELSES